MENAELLQKLADQQAQINKLQDEIQLKDRCLSLIAHDFSGISNNFLWLLNALEGGDIPYELFKSQIPELENQARNNQQSIESTIAWINGQRSGFKLQSVEFTAHELFSYIHNLLINNIRTKKILVKFQGDKDLILFGDRVLVAFILEKFVDNAIKYSYPEGVVIFDVRREDNDDITFTIQDSGMGMSSDVIGNLFTLNGSPYTGTANEKGTGLSLVVVNDFIKLIGATIEIRSEESLYTQIALKIPGLLLKTKKI